MSGFITRQGLRIDCPYPGDAVTVRVRDKVERQNPHHYRQNNVWRVLEVNAGHAVVRALCGSSRGRVETWSIATHEWFEASDLAKALEGAEEK